MDSRRPSASKRPTRRPTGPPPPWRPPFGVVRLILGSILAAAGAIKFYELGFEALDESNPTLLLGGFAEFQVLVGLWMLSGLEPEWTRRWSAGVFAGLALASLFQGLAGKCSCGCFGSLSINPWLAFVLNLLAVAALVWSRLPSGLEAAPFAAPMNLLGLGTLALIVGIVGRGQADLVTVAGTATADGHPLRETELKFTGGSGRLVLRTDHDGRFRLPLVRPGQYAVSAPDLAVPRPAEKRDAAAKARGKAKVKRRPGQPGMPRLPEAAAPNLVWIEVPTCPREDLPIDF